MTQSKFFSVHLWIVENYGFELICVCDVVLCLCTSDFGKTCNRSTAQQKQRYVENVKMDLFLLCSSV